MSIEQNKQAIVRYFERVNRGDKLAILECLTQRVSGWRCRPNRIAR
jgi:ketosteroid isomerase-like protein